MLDVVHSNLIPHKVLILADGNRENILYNSLEVLRNIKADDPYR